MVLRGKRVSSSDVAREAGVSRNTVLLVARDSPLVAPETKARIQRIITELGYRPNAAAAALRSARSHILGFLVDEIVPTLVDQFRHQILSAITTRAQAAAHYVLVNTIDDGETLISSGRIDGAIVDWRIRDETLALLVSKHTPVVLIGRDTGNLPVSWVRADEEEGSFVATQHLLSLGHTRLALLAAGDEHVNTIVADRVRGYRRALSEANVPFDARYTAYGDWTYPAGFRLGQQLLSLEPRPTAILVLNEMMALGLLNVAQDMGLRIPDDVSIVTIEDSPLVEYVRPQLTSIHVPMYDMGMRATELLLAHLADPDAPLQQVTLPTTLVVRASTAPCT